MDNEQPHQELVKCVVVGDTAVGKTRLICARACNKQVSLSQLLTTHVPTVWAIDQYRIYKDVLERSWEVVDSVNVSLRLWDTFGDHEKDRRFAYGRSDVVLLCFSVNSPVSLRNCKLMWYPEIRRFCPQTPVLLVGCKNDLRYMYRDETYLSYFRERSPFVRATRKDDLVMPDEARTVARELGVYYYETSVLTYYGVNEVFENAIRAALMARRQQRFWMTNLKRVQRPLLQSPFMPPKPAAPEVAVAPSTYRDHLRQLLAQQLHTDLVLVAGPVGFSVHRFVLAAASAAFHRLLAEAEQQWQAQCCAVAASTTTQPSQRSSSDSSVASSTFGEATVGEFNEDTEHLIRVAEHAHAGRSRELNHPAFQSIRVELQQQQPTQQQHTSQRRPRPQTVVTLSKLVTPQAVQQCLHFLYTGTIDQRCLELQEMRQAAEFLELPHLLGLLARAQPGATDAAQAAAQATCDQHLTQLRQRLQQLCLDHGTFADVTFELDDGECRAHRPMLMARCDMMNAMFSGDFRESQAAAIAFPGVRTYTFHKLLCYVYADELPPVSAGKCLNLLELANRLCLPRLVHLVERRVIEDLTRLAQSEPNETVEQCLRLLEPVKLHNAHQLADWCMNHLCCNYNRLCRASPRSMRLLHPDNQEYLSENRWPPVWYLKDYDYYQKCVRERQEGVLWGGPAGAGGPDEMPRGGQLKRAGSGAGSGCLCFSGGKARRAAAAAAAQPPTPDAASGSSLYDANHHRQPL